MSDKPFATVTDLEARWRHLDSDERARAEVLLGDASQMIRQLCPDWAKKPPATLRIVACSMVKRAMTAPTEPGTGQDLPAGTESMAWSAGSYSSQFRLANPNGDQFLSKFEKQLLGLIGGHFFETNPLARSNQ